MVSGIKVKFEAEKAQTRSSGGDSTIAINRAGVKQMAKEIDKTPGIKVL